MSKVIIVGGGISGVVAAIKARKNNHSVIILEKNDTILKKLLITGNGRCNYYNDDQSMEHYHSLNEEYLSEIITKDNLLELSIFHNDLGLVPRIKNGYYYPYSNQAVSVKNILENELKKLNVDIKTNYEVKKIEKKNNKFIINNDLTSDSLIISTGSKAYPKTGSTGDGYKFLKMFNHTINDVKPALVQLKTDDKYLKDLSGVRVESVISIYEDGKLLKAEEGELQLTNYGISGICVFNLSYLCNLNNNKKYVHINFLPFIKSKEELVQFLAVRQDTINANNIAALLEGLLNTKLINVILKKSDIKNTDSLFEITDKQFNNLINNIISYKMNIIGTNDFDNSQVCMGGVSLDEINLETMESKLVDNLYIIGELLDVNGDCGGYNITFAFISGILAGSNIND